MIVKFINTSGNWDTLETLTDPKRQDRMEMPGKVWREKAVIKVEKKVEKVAEFKAEPATIEEIREVDMDEQYKSFLKEKKVRGYALLKGESLKNKALAEGFTL